MFSISIRVKLCVNWGETTANFKSKCIFWKTEISHHTTDCTEPSVLFVRVLLSTSVTEIWQFVDTVYWTHSTELYILILACECLMQRNVCDVVMTNHLSWLVQDLTAAAVVHAPLCTDAMWLSIFAFPPLATAQGPSFLPISVLHKLC